MAQGAVQGRTSFNVQTRVLPLLAAIATAFLAGCGGGGGGGASDAAVPLAAATAATPTTAEGQPVSTSPSPAAQASGLIAAPAEVANTSLAGNQFVQAVSPLATGGYAVSWSDDSAVFVQRYDAQGSRAGGETRLPASNAAQSAIAVLSGGQAVIAAPDARGLVLRRADGQAAEAVVAATSSAHHPVLQALDDGGVAVGWAESTDSGLSQHVQRFDSQLRPVGAPIDFTAAGTDRNVSLRLVAAPGGNVIAGVTHRFQGIGYLQFRIAGRDVGPLDNASTGLLEFNTTLAPLADGRFALWSTGSNGGYLQLLDATGQPTGAPVPLAVVPETGVGLADGGWVTVTRQMQGQPTLARRFDAAGRAIGAPVEAAPGMSRPLLTARLASGFAMAWNFNGAMGDSDVRTQRIGAP